MWLFQLVSGVRFILNFVFKDGKSFSWCLSIATFINQVDIADLRLVPISRVVSGPYGGYVWIL